MEDIKVSILVPVYGVESYIERCARSIFEQTYQNLEIIFVDDCTPDKSIDILQRVLEDYQQRKAQTKIIKHEKNRGLTAARKTAYTRAKGDFVFFVDSDDWMDGDLIENYIRAEMDTDADVIMSDYYINTGSTVTRRSQRPEHCDPISIVAESLMNKLHAGTWCHFYKHSFLKKHNITLAPYSYYEDMYLLISVMMNNPSISYCPFASYHYRKNPTSLSNSQNIIKRIRSLEEMCKNMNILNERFHLVNDPVLCLAFYHSINFNKIKLIGEYYHYPKKLKKALRYFPESYAYIPTKTRSDKMGYLAVRYGFFLPFYLLGWKMRLRALWKNL